MADRTLTLRRERLTELAEGDLTRVAGARASLSVCLITLSDDAFETLQATRCFCP